MNITEIEYNKGNVIYMSLIALIDDQGQSVVFENEMRKVTDSRMNSSKCIIANI